VYWIVLLLIVALVSLLITRIATVALTVTGMARESARFQARSALSGVGFTTSEAESVVNHPVRRRIVMTLMLIGNVGLATAVAGLFGSFVNAGTESTFLRSTLLVGGLVTVYAASRSARVDRLLSRWIGAGIRRFSDLQVRDWERLLHLGGDYAVHELPVTDGHWLAGRSLADARLRDEGVLVLGITCGDGRFLGVPAKETVILEGDTVIVYGRTEGVAALSARRCGPGGDAEHARATVEQRQAAADPDHPDVAPPDGGRPR
jgi:hypothetical protein